MVDQWWSWILSIIGLAGFFLAGKKVWWCWYVNIANQVLWTVYALVTEQWGFLAATAAYTFVFTKNAISWTREHFSPSMRFVNEFNKHPILSPNEIRAMTGFSETPYAPKHRRSVVEDFLEPPKGIGCGWMGCGHSDCHQVCTPDPKEDS